ncbi:MAG: NADH-ubiquinone oxidoreductase-F iron-sulfur binding region domain-containing protein, partial [Gemmataceae bacterium]
LDPSGLLGMGGAGVPAFRKWFDVWTASGDEKYIVCNGDESEPGTFKDREIFLRMPHLVVEGVILAGLMTNATAGYIYIRHEYGEQINAVRAEIERAIDLQACGDGIFGTERSFPVEVFVSPGGYICGEQSALLEAMEDRRAQPRNRPPELATNGLRDRPTVVNNVETLAWTPATILKHSAENGSWYAKLGVDGAKGRRILSISGDLAKPGVYEVPIGLPLGDLIQLAGGVAGGKALKAVAPSGPSGGLLPALLPVKAGWEKRLKEKLNDTADKALLEKQVTQMMAGLVDMKLPIERVPLDLNLFRALGPILGISASVMLGAGLAVYAEGTDILSQAINYTEFFRNESCGKCVPCRIGSQKLTEIGTELLQQRNAGTIDLPMALTAGQDVTSLTESMILTSICGLGQVAPNPLATAFVLFPEEIVPEDA